MRKRVNTTPKKKDRESSLYPTIKTSFVRPIKKIDCLTTINLYNLNNLIPWKTRYKVTINILKMQALAGKTIRYITLINRLFPFSRHYSSLFMLLIRFFVKHMGRHKRFCSDMTKGLYQHNKHLVTWLQTACSPTINGIVQTRCQLLADQRVRKTVF